MTPEMVIAVIEFKYREHIEMEADQDRFLMRILASRIINLENELEYYKKRIQEVKHE